MNKGINVNSEGKTMNESNLAVLRASLVGKPLLFDLKYLEAISEASDLESLALFQSSARSSDRVPGTSNVILKNGTAIIPIHGPLSTRSSFWQMLFGGTSYEDLVNDMDVLSGMSDIKNVILDVDSPGGMATGVTDAEDAVHALRKSGKGVVTYCSGMNCSAAYWISSAAEHVFASPTSQIGSIGVVTYVPTDRETGYKAYTSKNAKNKAKATHNLQQQLDEVEAVFHTSVTHNRGITGTFLRENWGEGATFPASVAVKNRMADSIVNLRDLI